MTNIELKKKIASSNSVDWYKNLEVSFDFQYLGMQFSIKGVSAIFEFAKKQVTGWQKFDNDLPHELLESKKFFNTLHDEIIKLVNSYLNESESQLDSYWNDLLNSISRKTRKVLTYDASQTIFLIDLYQKFPSYFTGAYNTLFQPDQFNVGTKDKLYGALLAYEFTLKDHTQVTYRRNQEHKSIAAIKSEWSRYISETEEILIEHLNKSNEKSEDFGRKIDELQITKDKLITEWFKQVKEDEWPKWFDPAKSKISELELAYREKLKLEEPAKYWDTRGKKLKRQGWISLVILVAFVGLTSWSLGKLLWLAPDQIFSSWFEEDKSAAIRWSIVYVTLISFIAFCVRAITKVMFSSFHLSRDCEERYTLTYFYLSLLKDSKIDEKDRQLIIQSLFSRAETGLLKDDSSPTMPSDFTKFPNK